MRALNELHVSSSDSLPDAHALPDLNRQHRKGVPEVILAAGKQPEQVVSIAEAFLCRGGRAIISRIGPDLASLLRERLADDHLEFHPLSQMVVARRGTTPPEPTGGRVGILTAGTSDAPVAEQAAVLMREMGCQVSFFSDVGVAGIHRLFQPLHALLSQEVDAIVVAAGMDGALPSVVAGLVDVPVIGLPTSTGYGIGGQGVAALLSMLQTCAPGLAVVNIDNGIGAGAMAGLIANRAARARRA
ncbi:MAG: nickel pincer cofactor biosynthesis protein LarB [Chloroflexi bacterium]|nr:nickel pincer cofactor biosynthesis protein LarB [Chloroflexota bacterium]